MNEVRRGPACYGNTQVQAISIICGWRGESDYCHTNLEAESGCAFCSRANQIVLFAIIQKLWPLVTGYI